MRFFTFKKEFVIVGLKLTVLNNTVFLKFTFRKLFCDFGCYFSLFVSFFPFHFPQSIICLSESKISAYIAENIMFSAIISHFSFICNSSESLFRKIRNPGKYSFGYNINYSDGEYFRDFVRFLLAYLFGS